MPRVRTWAFLPALAAAFAAACGDGPTESFTVAGAYSATTFRVTPTGGLPVDVLAAGGSLALEIRADRTTAGTLVIPASVTGGPTLTADLAGTATQNGGTVRFQQSADTFVRDALWSVDGTSLRLIDAPVGGAAATITLTRR